jgi:hypothetical protein
MDRDCQDRKMKQEGHHAFSFYPDNLCPSLFIAFQSSKAGQVIDYLPGLTEKPACRGRDLNPHGLSANGF